MLQQPFWKTFLIIMICVLGALFALPNGMNPDHFPKWFPQHTVNLGLDLQGGSHLLLEVGVEPALQERLSFTLEGVRKALRTEKIGYINLSLLKGEIQFKVRKEEDASKVQRLIQSIDSDLEATIKQDLVSVHFTSSSLAQRKRHIVEQSIEIVRRRIDELGTREPLIQVQGDNGILVQIPGIENPTRVKQLLGKTAKMTFRLLDEKMPEVNAPYETVPPGTEVLPGDEKSKGQSTYYVVRKEVILGGENLVDAGVRFDEYNRPRVTFKFDSFGARKFGEATSKNIGRLLAIVLDNKVISAARINSTIHGEGEIQGRFTLQEANDLALLMRAGALVAPLTILEERTVGPDLGADSVRAGKNATIISIVMVAVFMMVAYSLFGIIANIAMVFNLILMISALSLIGATLTLPGIAGIALTMGMAVDANVLINERIKEEMRLGRRMLHAIDAGYTQAMTTIVDSNITTLIGGAALFFFGTGPVKGFGVTLCVGILVSMFTAITLTRLIVAYWLRWAKPKTLVI